MFTDQERIYKSYEINLVLGDMWWSAGPCVRRAATWWRAPAWVVRSTAWSTLTAANQTQRSGAWGAGSRSGARASANVLSPSCHQDAAGVPRNSARQVREQFSWQSDHTNTHITQQQAYLSCLTWHHQTYSRLSLKAFKVAVCNFIKESPPHSF